MTDKDRSDANLPPRFKVIYKGQAMPKLEIEQLPVLSDNYCYLLRDEGSEKTAVVDPGEAAPVLARLRERGLALDFILNTHHHWDHTGGNLALKNATGAKVVGHRADAARIPGLDIALSDGEPFPLGESAGIARDVSGHTRGHVTYWFPEDEAIFTGDTLFLMGCGRLFEGSPEEMWRSLTFFKGLPPATKVYCGHEYTQANARFALTVEPENEDLKKRAREVAAKRSKGEPTVPGTIAEELLTNPFLRAADARAFAELRRKKDDFKG